MYKWIVFLSCIIFLLFPTTAFTVDSSSLKDTHGTSADRDGSSFEKAIIIKYIGDYSKSIDQEYKYIKRHFGVRGKDWQLMEQSLIKKNNKAYDEMVIKLFPSQEIKTLYFDITEPSQKFMEQISSELE